MAPKKKGNKKANDDWEAELGEDIAPQAPAGDAPAEEPAANGDQEEETGAGGGMMAMLRRNKEKRKKKGIQDDFVEGEDPTTGDAGAEVQQAAEATMDDEFALPDKKGKGGKGKKDTKAVAAPAADADDADSGRILTKAEKEKLKKEREKQRKKEQVRLLGLHCNELLVGYVC